MDTTIGTPEFFKFNNSCLITSDANPLPPGEFILKRSPFTEGSFEISLSFFEKNSLDI